MSYYQTFRAPQTYDLAAAAFNQMSLYTGKPAINIPIYTIKHYGLEVPISLSYDASGFIPNKAPGLVGLNWSLLAGGMITRNINNIADETDGGTSAEGKQYGFFYKPNDSTYSNSNVLNVSNHLYGSSHLMHGYFKHFFELSPDLFFFNFAGHSGQFMKGQDGQFHVQGNGSYKIDVSGLTSVGSGGFAPSSYTGKIIITDDKGIKYEFGGSYGSIEYSYPEESYSNGAPDA
jgi:hypothetical protein